MRARDLLMRSIARLAALGWFRSVETSGLERVPSRGPVLVVANHDGGFVDPVLLAATLPRFPRFLAMATLWRTAARPFLWLAGAIPVYRPSDGAPSSNVRTFAACRDLLTDDGVIAIFPEGQASDEVRLLPVKTGAARIALGSRAAGAEGLRILPVGLIYESKASARARVYVRVGVPIDLDAELEAIVPPGGSAGEDDRETVGRSRLRSENLPRRRRPRLRERGADVLPRTRRNDRSPPARRRPRVATGVLRPRGSHHPTGRRARAAAGRWSVTPPTPTATRWRRMRSPTPRSPPIRGDTGGCTSQARRRRCCCLSRPSWVWSSTPCPGCSPGSRGAVRWPR